MLNNVLIQGGKTTLTKFLVEAVYLGVSAAITALLTNIINNPDMFNPAVSGGVLMVARILLGLSANLVDPKLKNT